MQYTRTGVTPGEELHQDRNQERSYRRISYSRHNKYMQHTRTGVTPGQELQKYILLQPQLIHAAHQDRSYRSISYSSHNKYMPTPGQESPGQELQKYITLATTNTCSTQDRSYRSISL